MRKSTGKKEHVLDLIKTSVNTLVGHPVIMYPLVITAFIQLLILEILMFAPRWPLVNFFGPIIEKQFALRFVHFPFFYDLLPKLFFDAQVPVYLFIGSFLSASVIGIVEFVNAGKNISLKSVFRKIRSQYIHIVLAAVLTFATVFLFLEIYDIAFDRALRIRSETGLYAAVKNLVIFGKPYFGLLINIFITILYAFILPIVVIEKVKIHKAILENFKVLFRHFWFIAFVIFLPMFLYVPIILIRQIVLSGQIMISFPQIQAIIIAISIIVQLMLEAVILTATTIFYLSAKERL